MEGDDSRVVGPLVGLPVELDDAVDAADSLVDPAGHGPRIFFQLVPETKQVKNRLHLDLMPAEGSRDEELERLLKLGARPIDDLRKPDGTGWVVLADPEGNEFCILRNDAERAAD